MGIAVLQRVGRIDMRSTGLLSGLNREIEIAVAGLRLEEWPSCHLELNKANAVSAEECLRSDWIVVEACMREISE
jgi:hypothetical protein